MSRRVLRHGAVWAGAILLAAGAAAWLMVLVSARPAAAQRRPSGVRPPSPITVEPEVATESPPPGSSQVPDWPTVRREIIESRGLRAEHVATEEAIERALAQPVADFDFDQTPLLDVVVQLNHQYKFPILLDAKALESVNVDPATTRITMSLKGVSLGSALDLLLDRLGLTWTIRSEVLLITTPQVANDLFLIRVYDVADLVRCRDKTNVVWDDYDSLIDAIEQSIEPDSWQDTGAGQGVVVGQTFANAHVLVVSNTPQVHGKIAKLLDDVRAVGAKAGPNLTPPMRSWPRYGWYEYVSFGAPAMGTFDVDPILSALYGPNVVMPAPAGN